MQLQCSYIDSGSSKSNEEAYPYTCHIKSASVIKRNTKISAITGKHHRNKTNADVTTLYFNNCVLKFVPRGLSDFFPFCRTVIIRQCGLKTISRQDLKGLENLATLSLNDNKLTTLPDNLFADMKKLSSISFARNQLMFLSSKLLQPIVKNKLVSINFRGNVKIDAFFKSGSGGVSLEALKVMIDKQCLSPTTAETIIVEDYHELIETDQTRSSREDFKNNFSSGAKEMWKSGSFSDLTIIVGGKEFKVHKCILAMQSPIIKAMLIREPEIIEMKINEFSVEAVKRFLKYLYTGEMVEEETCATELFALATQYGTDSMKAKYENIIYKNINRSNAYEIFTLAHLHSSDKLKQKAFAKLKKFIAIEELDDEMINDLEGVKILYKGSRKLLEAVRARKRKLPQ